MQQRISMTISFIGVLIFSFLFGAVSSTETSALTGSEFKAGRIIDDGLFYDGETMSPAQIQNFLNSKISSCDTWGQQMYSSTQTRAQYGQSRGYPAPYTCLKDYRQDTGYKGGESGLCSAIEAKTNRSAAQIIDDVARACHISQKVIIVMLQKEQGLITDDWPWSIQYRSAMGYGCPDTAACDSQYYGFFNQVYNAALQFQRYKADPSYWNHVPFMTNNVLYQANAPSCGSRSVYIENYATAGLYNYTPYTPNSAALNNLYGTGDSCSAYGNRNFWRYYNDWFGSTDFPQPAGGLLYRQTSTGRIYLVNDSTKYHIPGWDMMVNYGFDAYRSMEASDATLSAFSDGGTLTNLTWDTGGVYLVNKGVRYHVSSSMCTAWAFSCYDSTKVKALDSTFQGAYLKQGGSLSVLSYINGSIYKMTAGTRQPIANPKTMSDLGLNGLTVLPASAVNSNYPLGTLLITTPGVISFSPSTAIYYYDGSQYFKVPSMNVFNDWNLSKAPQLYAVASSYNTTPPSSTQLASWMQVDGKKYIVDQGRKLVIPDSLGSLYANELYTVGPVAQFNSLPTHTLHTTVWTNPKLYKLEDGQKRHIPSHDDYVGIESTPAKTTSLRADKITPIQTGPEIFANGKLVSISNDTKMYVVSNNTLIHIPGPRTFDYYGFDWSKISVQPSTITSTYPFSGTSLSHSKTLQGNRYIESNERLTTLTSDLARDYGLKDTSLAEIDQGVVKRTNVTQLSRFLYNSDNGRIYYASGGAIHYVASSKAFVAYGGTTTRAEAVNTATLNLFTIGEPVY
jgi:hypothetical protein